MDEFELGSGEGGYLLYLGRIHPDKGTVEAFEVAEETAIPLILAGIIQDQSYFDRFVAPRVDGERVTYVGPVEAGRRSVLLGGSQALLHLINFDEPFGFSVIESMACGTPVIATARGSMPEIIRHGETGFLVSSHDEAVEAVQASTRLDRQAIGRLSSTASLLVAWSRPALRQAPEWLREACSGRRGRRFLWFGAADFSRFSELSVLPGRAAFRNRAAPVRSRGGPGGAVVPPPRRRRRLAGSVGHGRRRYARGPRAAPAHVRSLTPGPCLLELRITERGGRRQERIHVGGLLPDKPVHRGGSCSWLAQRHDLFGLSAPSLGAKLPRRVASRLSELAEREAVERLSMIPSTAIA